MNDEETLYLVVLDNLFGHKVVNREYGYDRALHRAKVLLYSKDQTVYIAKVTEEVKLSDINIKHVF